MNILKKFAEDDNMTLQEYVSTYISKYAAVEDENGVVSFDELVAEIMSKSKGDDSELAITLLSKVVPDYEI